MNYCFDIDGTICTNTDGKYEEAMPYLDVIGEINYLYEQGHNIVFYTARGSTTRVDWRRTTEKQFENWGVKHHGLHFGKPHADLYVDDKGVSFSHWSNKLNKDKTAFVAENSVLSDPIYLETTYSVQRAPYTIYPFQLSQWLYKNIFKETGLLLDLGCGRGEYLKAFEELGFDSYGIDISPIAAQNFSKAKQKITNLENEEIPFEEDYFDFVFSKSVIEHSHHPVALMKKTFRMLRPEGKAVFMTPSWEFNYRGAFYIDHTHVTPFTAVSLVDAMKMAGYKNVTAIYFYQLPILWKYPLLKPFIKIICWLPLRYRPLYSARWPEGLNKLIRFSKEIMLLAVGEK